VREHQFARYLDFLSIGTNDLIQYTLAIDRVDNEVNYLYDPLHPAVLTLIRNTIRAGHQSGYPGELVRRDGRRSPLYPVAAGAWADSVQYASQPVCWRSSGSIQDSDVGELSEGRPAVVANHGCREVHGTPQNIAQN
jgi:phosphotransferase system enzyme I (PtsI)